jgi:transcriptional regulator with XRE-family HTH domain
VPVARRGLTDKRLVSALSQFGQMETVRFGRGIRALRRRRGWRQEDLGAAVGVSRAAVSRIELGQADRLTVRTLEAVAAAVGARVEIRLSWNGEALDRLLDVAHARLVESVVARLEKSRWEAVPEVSFNVAGERGSIDILAFHPPTGSLLVVEVKSVVPDIQAMLGSLDRKARLARGLAPGRDWTVTTVSRLLVIGEDRTARRRVAAFESTFRRAFPERGATLDGWLRSPDPSKPVAGLRFWSGAPHTSARHRISGRRPV